MICASLYRPFFIVNLLRYLAEKILLLNTANFRGDYPLMTLGGFKVASSLSVYNGQVLAMGDITFSANADGVKGASFISYGQIDGTSNMDMGFCRNSGMENAYRAPYFRMVN